MPNLKTPEEVRDYINSHSFLNRYHAHCIRALIMSKYEEEMEKLDNLSYNYPMSKLVEPDKPVISANDAIKFLTEKTE